MVFLHCFSASFHFLQQQKRLMRLVLSESSRIESLSHHWLPLLRTQWIRVSDETLIDKINMKMQRVTSDASPMTCSSWCEEQICLVPAVKKSTGLDLCVSHLQSFTAKVLCLMCQWIQCNAHFPFQKLMLQQLPDESCSHTANAWHKHQLLSSTCCK